MNILQNRAKVKGLIGLILIVVAVGLIFWWEAGGLKEKMLYTEVIVLNQEVEYGTAITESMIDTKAFDELNLISGVITNKNEVVGKVARNFIPKGVQLHKKFFETPKLNLKSGEFVFSVPEEWIYSLPQTTRRGDSVFFYPITEGEDDDFTSDTLNVNTSSTPITSATAIYIKDSSNREVLDVKEDRLDGTALVSQLEVIIDNERYAALKTTVESGCKFIIMYD